MKQKEKQNNHTKQPYNNLGPSQWFVHFVSPQPSCSLEEIILCMDFVLSGCVSCYRICCQMASRSEDLERQKPRMLSQPLVTRTQGGLTGRKDLLQQSQVCTMQCARFAVDTGSTNSFCLWPNKFKQVRALKVPCSSTKPMKRAQRFSYT